VNQQSIKNSSRANNRVCIPFKPIEGYYLVVISAPVWAGKITPAIRKFMVTNDFKERDFALFVTLDGNKPEKSLENMKAAISTKRLVGEFGFIRPMENEEKTEEQVKTWCSELGKSLGPT